MKPISIFSTNNHELYLPFMEPVSRAWENLGFEPMCVNTSEKPLVDDSEIPVGNQAQMVRVLMPALYPERMFIVSDIDMLPLSADYFQNLSVLPKENEIVNVSADAYQGQKRLPICYFAGMGSTFSAITGIKTHEDIVNVMRKWWKQNKGWETDEICFTAEIIECLNEGKVKFSGYARGWTHGRANFRIDRDFWSYDKDALMQGKYIDSHMLRPLNANRQRLVPLFESVGVNL
jgi:hypothetical protein